MGAGHGTRAIARHCNAPPCRCPCDISNVVCTAQCGGHCTAGQHPPAGSKSSSRVWDRRTAFDRQKGCRGGADDDQAVWPRDVGTDGQGIKGGTVNGMGQGVGPVGPKNRSGVRRGWDGSGVGKQSWLSRVCRLGERGTGRWVSGKQLMVRIDLSRRTRGLGACAVCTLAMPRQAPMGAQQRLSGTLACSAEQLLVQSLPAGRPAGLRGQQGA